jgi:adenylate kinase
LVIARSTGARSCPVRIVLLGAPGSGKGTQGQILAARLGVRHVASGELLRAAVAARSELGNEVAESLARGDLVPDDTVIGIVADAVASAAAVGGYILDGFPRTRSQAERAFALAVELGIEPDAAVYLSLDDAVARQRLAARAGGGRVDDANASVIEHRLEVFHANMQPILDFYAGLGILVTVDASQPVDAVTDAILAALPSART